MGFVRGKAVGCVPVRWGLLSLAAVLCWVAAAQAVTIGDGSAAVNHPNVVLALNPPANCYSIEIRNEENAPVTFSPTATVAWALSPGEGTKQVTVIYRYWFYVTEVCDQVQCNSYCCGFLGSCSKICYDYCPVYCQRQYSSSSNESATVILDQTPPLLNVSTLPDGSATNVANLTVSGTVTDTNGLAEVRVGETPLTVGAFNLFSTTVALGLGPNTITVVATDIAGNASGDSRTITYDNIPPQLTLDAAALTTRNPEQTLSGTVEAGCTVSAQCATALAAPVAYPTAGTWTVTVSALTPGQNAVTVRATDAAGNVTTRGAAITLEVDPGDANIDTVVDLADAILILQVAAGTVPDFPTASSAVADFNGDGQVGLPDALYLFQVVSQHRAFNEP